MWISGLTSSLSFIISWKFPLKVIVLLTKLSNSYTSTATNLAVTPYALNEVYKVANNASTVANATADVAVEARTTANNAKTAADSATTAANSAVKSIKLEGTSFTVSNGVATISQANARSALGLQSAAYREASDFATSSDLSSYVTSVSLNNTLNNYITSSSLTQTLNDYAKTSDIPDAYTLPVATSSILGGVKVGSNITVSSGVISLTKANVTAALGYTPPASDTNTTYSAGNGLTLSGTIFSLDRTSARSVLGISYGTGEPSGGSVGDIYIQYS